MATSDAPISIGSVTLCNKNRSEIADFYQNIIGLDILADDKKTLSLGVDGQALLHLQENPAAKRRPTEAGLFHTAFLLPSRTDLGAWLIHAARHGVKIDGAADHLVSEAIYLHDPEGNGIEIYADRDRSEWTIEDDKIKIDTLPLDLNELAASSNESWQGAPRGSVIGHVHLQVGDVDQADEFYRDSLGFDQSARSPSMGFYGSGGYHHHVGANTWNSKNAGQRSLDSTGLTRIDFRSDNAGSDEGQCVDPWGIEVSVSAA